MKKMSNLFKIKNLLIISLVSLLLLLISTQQVSGNPMDACEDDLPEIIVLRKQLRGRVLTPSNADYKEQAKLHNFDHPSAPAVIIQCIGTADIVKATKFCQEFEKKNPQAPKSTVRSGGHSFKGVSSNVGGCVIDLRLHRAISVNSVDQTAWVEAGATGGDVDKELYQYGFFLPTGTVSSTGIGGLATGGGMGRMQKYGLLIDNILEWELVTKQGEVISISAVSNSDLVWAMRGGARWLGTVTKFKFKVHPLPSEKMTSAFLAWDVKLASKVQKALTFLIDSPNSTAWGAIATPDKHDLYALHVVSFSDKSGAERLLQKVNEIVGQEPLAAIIPLGERTWWEINSELDFLAAYGDYSYSVNVAVPFDEKKVEQFYNAVTPLRLPNVVIILDYFATSVAATRKNAMFDRAPGQPFFEGIFYAILPKDASENDRNKARQASKENIEKMLEATKSVRSKSQYINFASESSSKELFHHEKWMKLNELKAKYNL
jgi:hypothetical protein